MGFRDWWADFRVTADTVAELVVGVGLISLWLSFLLLAINMRESAGRNPQLAVLGLNISPVAQGFFFIGDGLVGIGGVVMLFQLHYSGASESARLRWSALYLGLLFSVHMPIVTRSLVFQANDFYASGGFGDEGKLLFAAVATAVGTAVCLVVTVTAAIAVDFVPRLRYNDRIKALSKWTIVTGIACGELYFVAGLMEFQRYRTVHSSVVLLVLSFVLVALGYVPARFFSECQHYFEEDIPLMR